MSAPDLEFVYVGDPMCSWCWGFAPVLDELERSVLHPLRLPLSTVVGGLRPGPAASPLDDAMRATLAHHWEKVAATSGQPFSPAGLERDGWIYDTELPAIAVVAVRELNEEATLPFFMRLQRAFYAEAVDITDPAAYPQLLEGIDVAADGVMAALDSDSAREAAWGDFRRARALGVNGFPTLLLREDDAYHVVTRGYAPADRLLPALSGWMAERFGAEAGVDPIT